MWAWEAETQASMLAESFQIKPQAGPDEGLIPHRGG